MDVERRWVENRRRARMLDGSWEIDLRETLAPLVDRRRLERWRELDLSKNIFASVVRQIAVLYGRPPVVSRDDGDVLSQRILWDTVQDAGLWQLAASNQQLVIGLREGAIRVHVFDDPYGDRKISYEVVSADRLHAVANPNTPDEPHTVYHYRLRKTSDGDLLWTRDAFSVADPMAPWFRVEDPQGTPITELFPEIDAVSGDAYGWRTRAGRPYIPIVLYHALRTGHLWDWSRGIELVDGSLRIAGLWTMWQHVIRDASWPQRYTIGLEVQGVEIKEGMATVLTDHASVLAFHSRPGVTGSAGQFEPGGDPEAIGRAILASANDLSGGFDISPAEIKRVHGDARSGYAIEVTRDGQREAQRRFEPQMQRGDLAVIAITAAMLGLPDTDWRIRYTGVPATFSERQLLIEEYDMRMRIEVASPVQILAVLDDISEDEARVRLRRIRMDRLEFLEEDRADGE